MEDYFIQLAISLGLGLLVGLQREHVEDQVAGIRTFPIITIFGTLTGWMSIAVDRFWIIGFGLLSVAILLFSVNLLQSKMKQFSLGQTTEMAILAMFSIGSYIPIAEYKLIPVVVGALIAVLLYAKEYLSALVDKMGNKELTAIMQFVAISLIILPVLPDKSYGPYDVFNPRSIWFMVVLIVGIGVIGYFVYKLFGDDAGTLSSGILGGMISSTATTVTFAKRSSEGKNIGKVAAFIIVTASAISFIRIIIEIGAVSPNYLGYVAPPILSVALLMIIIAIGFYWKLNQKKEKLDPPKNPAQLKSALIFGALYAFILLAVAVAEDYFGQNGLFVVAIISGLTDVDAITLSVAHRMNSGNVEAELAWRLILVATFANLVFKGGLAFSLGDKVLKKWIVLSFMAVLIYGILVLLFWPSNWHFNGSVL